VKQRFSLEQLQILESALKENLYPSRADIEELTKKLNTTSNRVRNWFVNR